MIRVHVWYEFSSSFSLLLRLRRASSTFSWLRRLRALPSGPTALTTGRRYRTGVFVFIWCDVRFKWRKRKSVYRAWKSTGPYSVRLQWRRHLFYCCTRIRPCWWLHTGSTQNSLYQHIATYNDLINDGLMCSCMLPCGQLVLRRSCEVVLFYSYLVKHSLTAVPLFLIEYIVLKSLEFLYTLYPSASFPRPPSSIPAARVEL